MHERAPRPTPRAVDGLVVAAVAGVAVFGLVGPVVTVGARLSPVWVPALALGLAQAGVLWFRRRRPVGVLGATVGVLVLSQAIGDMNAASQFGSLVAAYSVGAYAGRRGALAAAAVAAAGALADRAVVAWVPAAADRAPMLLGATGVLLAAAWGVGRYVATRRAYLAAVLAHARQEQAERDEQARRAVLEERRRIARDLHDQVAHHLGVVSLQTAAARRWLDRDPARTGEALASAERAARTALETMPAILAALRADDRPTAFAPQPGLDGLDGLLADIRAAGVDVDLVVAGARRTLPPPIELTAYRVVQESLTNVLKHAGGARATVALRFAADRLEIEVTDDGDGRTAATRGDGTRLGLVGMRERVESCDGRLQAGPGPDGGYRVVASLPLGVTAPAP